MWTDESVYRGVLACRIEDGILHTMHVAIELYLCLEASSSPLYRTQLHVRENQWPSQLMSVRPGGREGRERWVIGQPLIIQLYAKLSEGGGTRNTWAGRG